MNKANDIIKSDSVYLCRGGNGKTYLAILKGKATRKDALQIAKLHFKAKADRYEIKEGFLIDGELYIGRSPLGAVGVWAAYLK